MSQWKTMAALVQSLGLGAFTAYLEVTRVLVRERVWRVTTA